MSIPRSEHPRPQFKRENWLNLNGEWDFAFDFGLSGKQRNWHTDISAFSEKITVPFCPESKLSGVEYTDFIPSAWYHRRFEIPNEWKGKRVKLHFGAVDYDCRVWINGHFAGRHVGGSSSFCFDITHLLENNNQIVVNALDNVRSSEQPAGKQSQQFYSSGCKYTRTTGIWQTVWLEAVPDFHLESVRIVPDFDEGSFYVTPVYNKTKRGMNFRAVLLDGDQEVARREVSANSGKALTLALDVPHSWHPDDPFLYGLRLETLENGRVIDRVDSYAGLRKFHIEDNKFFLNNTPIYLRFVLDQGFYPDGIWTAPDDSELKADIERAQAVGFNGARLHQKVFEERFHYWADRLGYLTWGESPDWGMNTNSIQAIHNHQREWREVLLRDVNHPSIIAWTPFNEQRADMHLQTYRQAVQETYDLTRNLDPTRPVNDASGWTHVKTDIYTVHDYDQNPDTLEARYNEVDPADPGKAYRNTEHDVPYARQPYVVDEYGGTFWAEDYPTKAPKGNNRGEWGYGKSSEEVTELIRQLTHVLLDNPNVAGYTFTQLTDVEQEINGIYTYDRQLKFNPERLKKAFGAKAAIEE